MFWMQFRKKMHEWVFQRRPKLQEFEARVHECSKHECLFFQMARETILLLIIIIIIIIIIGSIPRRAFQYLFTSDTFDRLINVYKNNYKRNL